MFSTNLHKMFSGVSLAAAVVMAVGSAAGAAQIWRLDLLADGSMAPPGDRLEYAVAFGPNEAQVVLKVRAYSISGEANAAAQAIRAGGDQQRGERGEYLQIVTLQRPAASTMLEGSVVVAYADLDLPRGQHLIGYEVTGEQHGETVFARVTPLTRITISAEPRRQMRLAQTDVRREAQSRRTSALVAGIRTRGGGELEKLPVAVTTETVVREPRRRLVDVNIPGGYQRDLLEPTGSQTASSAAEAELQPLQQQPWRPLSELVSDSERSIFFATNRLRQSEGEGPAQFSAEVADTLAYGACIVNIPVDHHRPGNLETPSWWGQRDPEKHFLVESLALLDKQEFLNHVREGDVLLFVHGFNNTLEAAVLRTAQLHYDLGFPGPAVTFSWPSLGQLTGYETDGKHAAASAGPLAEMLEGLIDPAAAPGETGRRVHVIAHSMGNRVLLGAVYDLFRTGKLAPGRKVLGQVVLAAPDVGAIMFNNLLPYVVGASDRVTYYYCSRDTALAASRQVNYYEPVGLFPYFDRGLDTINADGVDTSFLGHNYYASARTVLRDVELLMKRALPPAERIPPLAGHAEIFGHRCWSFTSMKTEEISEERP